MTTKNSMMLGRAQRLQLTKLGALLLIAAPMAAFSSGCGNVGPENDAEGKLGQTQQALTTCVTLDATADAMISDPPKSQNYGSHPLLRVGGKDESLIKFDLASIPAQAAINSATLKLYTSGVAGSNQVNIHAANAAWNESTVSFQSFNQQFDGAIAAIINPSTPTTYNTADLTGLVNAWRSGAKVNNGILLEREGNQKVHFSSRNANGSTGPTLTVCYTTPDENHCASNPCVNGACTNTQESYTCACDPGWTGTNCETNINECAGNPCQNGGLCTDGLNSYTCDCPAGFTGANCETNIDECAANPCQNGGICTDGVNSYSCSCEPGYGGTNCEIDIDECYDGPCLNGSMCTDNVNGYTCGCLDGFTGTNCEIDIDECASNPCQNGQCIDGANFYTCACDPGFEGTNCENNIDECAGAPCLNNGSCTDGLLSYTCACAPGYTGTNCEINIDDCAANPCQNDGICVDGVNKYTCSCPVGWIGTSCETVAVFAPPTPAVPGTLRSERIADFNNDGYLDVLAMGTQTPLRLALGNGDGTFQAPVSPTTGYVGPNGEAFPGIGAYTIGDFNRDGNVDFFVSTPFMWLNTYDFLAIVGLGNGDGTFQYQNFGLPSNYGTNNIDGLISGDWNGDGNLDLMGFAYGNALDPFSALALRLGNGDGTFQPAVIPILSNPPGTGIPKAADFNGDGHLDLAVSLGLATYVFLSNGDGTFLSPAIYGVSGDIVREAIVADLNSDGMQDLLTAVGLWSIRPLLNNGDGTFQAGSATPFNVANVALGDWDGDGHADVAGTQPGLGLVVVRLGNGDGTFQAEGAYSGFVAHPFFGPRSISARDFDENGSLDLLVGGAFQGHRFMRNLNASIDACNPNPCQNGGTCNLDGNSYTCSCTAYWTGATCTAPHTYDCVNDSPCTQANADNLMFIFAASSSPSNYIQCVSVGQCQELSCNPGTTFDQVFLTCQ